MTRRGGLYQIAEVPLFKELVEQAAPVAETPPKTKPVKAITKAQRAIVDAGADIRMDRPILEDAAYLARQFVQATLPHSDPKADRWRRVNGRFALGINAGFNPATGEPIASVVQATPASYEHVASRAAEAFARWRLLPAPKRGELVRDLGQALRELKEPLGDLVSLEMGKIRAEGHGEVQEMIDVCDFAVGLSRQLYGLTMASERPGHRMMEQWHPLGPVGVITAFNFPVAVWAWNSAIAAVCGDPVVWKPAAPVPLCALAVQHVANQVMADHGVTGVFTLAVGPGSTVGERMLNDPRLPLVSFTGSTQVGRRVAAQVAQRFGRTILELGGNNAIVVTEGANLDLAERAIVFGAVGTAGQRCTTTRRLLLQQGIHDRFVAALREGQKVEFEVTDGPKGKHAQNIQEAQG